MFSLFQHRKNILEGDLLKDSTDVHCHLLPGVDDGFQNVEDTEQALSDLAEMGVTQMIFTPHVMEDLSNTRASLQQHFEAFCQKVKSPVRLKLAAEYMLDAGFTTHVSEGLLTMGFDRRVLVETSYFSPPPDLDDMLYQLKVKGYIPILAHPERYAYMMMRDYERLKHNGYLFQLNYLSLGGFYGKPAQMKARDLLKARMYDYTGSDCHNLGKHHWGLSHLNLSSSETQHLRRLFDNNRTLFVE
jgi:protein-tyrosine phosphatase